MNSSIYNQTEREEKPLTREDVERLLQEVRDSEQLNLSGQNLQRINLSLLSLNRANLSRADLSGAILTRAEMVEVNLSEANLSDARLDRADLSGAILTKAILTDASFQGADLTDANLSGAFRVRTTFSEALLTHATGLEENNSETAEPPPMLRVRIVEEPLTISNLNSIISSLTELSTKYWLIAKGRFADLIEYTQTRNERFAEEANIVVTRISYNSPFKMDWKVDISAPSVAEALVKSIDGITQRHVRLEQAELANQREAQQIKRAEQQAGQDLQMAELEREKQQIEIEQRRLDLLEKQLDVQRKGIKYAMEMASTMVDLLHPGADPATRAMEIQALLPNLVQLQNGKGLEIAFPARPTETPTASRDAE